MPIADTAEEINKLNEFIQAINTLQGNERNSLIVTYIFKKRATRLSRRY